MAKKSTSVQFFEWVLDGIRTEAGDMLQDGELFDERKLSLQALIDRPLAELGGMACLVSLPKMQHDNSEPEDSRTHIIRVLVYIRCNPALTESRSAEGELLSFSLADKLYSALDAQRFERIGECTANVTTTNLTHSSEKSRGMEHAFEVTARITL